MLIRYFPELLMVQYEPNREEDTTAKPFIPTFTVEDIAVDDEHAYAKVFGNIDDFKSMNADYEEIDSIPDSTTYLTDPKFGLPSDMNTFFKLRTRERITSEVGDEWDLIADISKRLTMSERLITLLALELINNLPDQVPETKNKYQALLEQYRMVLLNSQELDIADLENPIQLFSKLLDRSIKITNIVKEDYLKFKE